MHGQCRVHACQSGHGPTHILFAQDTIHSAYMHQQRQQLIQALRQAHQQRAAEATVIEEIEAPTSTPLPDQAGIIEGPMPTNPAIPLMMPAAPSASRKRPADDELSSEHLKRMHVIAPAFDSCENDDAMELA